MKPPVDPINELLKEKSLTQIWWRSRSIKVSRFNMWLTYACLTIMFIYVVKGNAPLDVLLQQSRAWSEMGISLTTTILGFLIAGFTVFATLTKTDLFILMAQHQKKGTDLSYLKYNFFSFMRVFVHYLLLLSFCIAVKMTAFPGGPLPVLIKTLSGRVAHDKLCYALAACSVCMLATYFVYTLLLLKSFVFDIYHVIMTVIKWEWERKSDETHS